MFKYISIFVSLFVATTNNAMISRFRLLPAKLPKNSLLMHAAKHESFKKTSNSIALPKMEEKAKAESPKSFFKKNKKSIYKWGAGLCAGYLAKELGQTIYDLYDIQTYEKQRENLYAHLKLVPHAAVAQKYIQELEAEEQLLMKELFDFYGLDDAKWNKLLELSNKECKQINLLLFSLASKNIPAWIKSHYQITLKSLGLDKVTIRKWRSFCDGLFMSELMAMPHDIIFSEIQLMENQKLVRKGLKNGSNFDIEQTVKNLYTGAIIHEMMHILHQDTVKKHALNLLSNKVITNISLINRINKFSEKRADVMAALLGPDIAKSNILYFELIKIRMPGIEACEDDDHLNMEQRIQFFQKIQNEMLEEIQKNCTL